MNICTGKPNLTIGQLEKWALDRKYSIDASSLDSTIALFKDASNADGVEFYLFASTKRLIAMCQKANHLCIDATHKVVYQGFPVFLIGTTDRMRAFHPFGFAMCSRENHEAFAFVLQSIVELNMTIFNYKYEPEYIMADGAESITKALRLTFNHEYKRGMCWFHVTQNIGN